MAAVDMFAKVLKFYQSEAKHNTKYNLSTSMRWYEVYEDNLFGNLVLMTTCLYIKISKLNLGYYSRDL